MNKFEAGKYINQSLYKSFQPNTINRNWVIDDMIVTKLTKKLDI